MQVRVGSDWSSPRSVTGGVPQGSILGVFFFNVATDDLEEGSGYVKSVDRPEVDIESDWSDNESEWQANLGWGGDRTPPAADARDANSGDSSVDSFHTARSGTPSTVSDDSDDDEVFASTPSAEAGTDGPSFTPSPLRGQDMDVILDESDVLPGGMRRRVVYSSEGDVTPPPEPTTTCLGAWKRKKVEVDKYVDDNLQEECVSFENAVQVTVGGDNLRIKHAIQTQNVFRHVVRRAEERGMKVNTAKTGMLCVSDSLNYKTQAYIEDASGGRGESGEKLKVLGWHFSSRPTVEAHIQALKKRFRERYWVLRHLKHNGFDTADLLKVYVSMLTPVADYMMEVYHSMLTDSQDEVVERLQSHALKCIFGPRILARRMRELADITTLRDRSIEYLDKFAVKCARNPRFEHWFVEKEGGRNTRRKEKYEEEFARCDRLYNSPIFYMRRHLNGKPGRTYGARNNEYRR